MNDDDQHTTVVEERRSGMLERIWRLGAPIAAHLCRTGWEVASAVKDARRDFHAALTNTVKQQIEAGHPEESRRVTPLMQLTSFVLGFVPAVALGTGILYVVSQLSVGVG